MKPKVLKQRMSDIENVLMIQCSNGNWNYDPYMHGMANGMILIRGLLKGVDDIKFLEAPKKWLKDKKPKVYKTKGYNMTPHTLHPNAQWIYHMQDEGFTQRELGVVLGISVSTVNWHIKKLKALKLWR